MINPDAPRPVFSVTRAGFLVIQVALIAFLGVVAPPLHGQPARPAPSASRTIEKDPEKELAQLARALREDKSAAAYARLSQFADRHSRSPLGARAALALGYHDYTKARYAQALRWLERAGRRSEKAPGEPLLHEYVLYWQAQVDRAQGRDAEALDQLERFRREFPESVMTEQVVASLAETSLQRGQAQRAVTALETYDRVAAKPELLLLRARAREAAAGARPEGLAAAARDYQAVDYRFPLSDEAGIAAKKLPQLARTLGEQFPGVPIGEQMGRAAALYDAHRWREARAAYEEMLPKISGPEHERAELRIAACRIELGAAPNLLASLSFSDAEVDGERLYLLSQFFRAPKREAEMVAAIEQLAARYPQSRWAEEGLFAAGNYFWVNLDRARAASFYRRVLEKYPTGKNSLVAQWRLAWIAYLERSPEAARLLEDHLRRFPGSSYTADALYWLGRVAERDGNLAHARGFYRRAQDRFPQTYFGLQSAERLRVLGDSPMNSADFLALLPSAPPLPQFDEPIPPAAGARWVRARALESIAFDASAELELRAAYAATGALRLLAEAAQAALAAGRYPVAISTARQVYPQLEARRLEEVPADVWRTAFPLPFERSIKHAAARQRVDPMLVAGIIRQESAFQPDAVSRAGAVGLMQVLPKTGRKLARRLKLRYSRARLFDPEYNLRLGTLYLADLLKAYGNPIAALAAFNAGEERVDVWEKERSFEEPAEFVESIPFTETREYVQIVMRNAEVYRLLYENSSRGTP